MEIFNPEEKLELLLPTYNRKEHLARTLEQLTAENSPVRNCRLTILNNNSTDGTAELIDAYCQKFPNVRHIRHGKNIGGNANIVRAFEMARAEYVWVVCDDDSFDWSEWGEILPFLQSGQYDAILTRQTELKKSKDLGKIVRQCSFLPAAIYRTENITSGVLINMHNNIPNLFPHLALICHILNKKGAIGLPEGELIKEATFAKETSGDGQYTRGSDQEVYVPTAVSNMFWTVGFINSLQLVEDKKLRTYLLDHIGNHGFFGYIFHAFKKNYTHYHHDFLNRAFLLSDLNFRQRMQFRAACFLLRVITLLKK